MSKLKTITFVCLMAYTSPLAAQEAGTKARLAFEHWWCLNLIDAMSEKDAKDLASKYSSHFDLGLKYAGQMVDELEKYGDKNNENWRSNAPLFFRWLIRGPSKDFIIGRLFEGTQNEAYDEIYKVSGGYRSDFDRHTKASNDYNSRNCKILN